MSDKVTLITGTSTGLGAAVAVQAAAAGQRVYVTMRDLGKRDKLDRAAVATEFCRLKTESDPDGTLIGRQVYEQFLGS